MKVLKLSSETAPRNWTRFKGIDARPTTHLHASITSIVSVEPDRVQKISLLFSFTVSIFHIKRSSYLDLELISF
jgi:hypothetical protein